MAISYDNLWKLMIDKKMNKTDLQNRVQLSSSTVAKLAKCKPVSLSVLERICKELNCDFKDIITYQDEDRLIDEFEL
ncbi:MAG: helix-turn-helix transcriptional regulator [Anaerotignum sp.]|nr:helix-turn-helix transcriptional regulator [Anaerotignum sp.]MBQ7084539.1 helix-turn-helix transcriptional regulator [Anaerotignum sp.]